MLNMIVKIGVVVTSGTLVLSLVLFYLSTRVENSDAVSLFRLGVTLLFLSPVFGVMTWGLQELITLKAFRKRVEARLFVDDLDSESSVLRTIRREEF